MTWRNVLRIIGQVALSLLSLAVCMTIGFLMWKAVEWAALNSSVGSIWPIVLIAGLLLAFFGRTVFRMIRTLRDDDLEDFRK